MENIVRKDSRNKKRSILYMINNGEYSLGHALQKTEELNDAGKLIASDYEELSDYINELMDKEAEQITEQIETENTTENLTENSAEEENIESEEEQ